ncbi:MAG: anti-sigma factor [Vicinamibacterales bacterium]
MIPAHDEQALAAAYVLGALEPLERRAFEAHAATCALCREEVRSLSRVTDALAYSAPTRTPRPQLRSRVLASILGETFSEAAHPPHDRQSMPLRWLPLAAAIVVTAGLGWYAASLHGRLQDLEGRLVSAERRALAAETATQQARQAADHAQLAMAVLAAPDLARIDLAGQSAAPRASARALWSRNRGMVFTTANLPPAPSGRVYQVWVVTADARVSAGLLPPQTTGDSAAIFKTPPDIAPPLAVAVTLEPAGGVPQPTGEMYLVGKAAL